MRKENTATEITILCANIKCNTVISFETPTCGKSECLAYWVDGSDWLDEQRAKYYE